MAEIRIEVPADLGLSQEEIAQLSENFRSQVVGIVGSRQAGTVVRARPQSVAQAQLQSQAQDVNQTVEVR